MLCATEAVVVAAMEETLTMDLVEKDLLVLWPSSSLNLERERHATYNIHTHKKENISFFSSSKSGGFNLGSLRKEKKEKG
jgi:hypothetical protein